MTLISNAPLFCHYNGVTFPVETETTGMKITPVPDAAGRAVKYILYSITLKATIGQVNQVLGESTDATMGALRKRLTAYAGEFHYESVGLGQLSVNVPPGGPVAGGQTTTARDVVWGPKPRLLEWKPLGQLACEIVWTVEVAIPECDSARYAFALMEFCFTLTTTRDKSGYTQRTFSGFLRIPQTRASVSTRTLSDNADAYLERIYPPLIPGFRRISGKTVLSEDKCRLGFDWTDEEMAPNALPEGVVDVQASETVSTPFAIAGKQWTVTISATYEMAREQSNGAAFAHFIDLVNDRLRSNPAQQVIPLIFQLAEPEIHGRKGAAFSMVFTIISSLLDIVKHSGIWRPVPGANWQKWSQTIPGHKPRGNANLRVGNDVDAIIDLCQPAGEYSLRAAILPFPFLRIEERVLRAERPSREASWLRYESEVRFEDLDETYELKTLPSSPGKILSTEPFPAIVPPPTYSLTTGPLASGSASGGGQVGFLDRVTVTPSPDVVVQRRAEPSRYCWLVGAAIRAGYPVDVPDLASVGENAAVRACRLDRGEGVRHKTETALFGIPVYSASWNIRYLLSGRPTQAEIPAHPYV